MNRLKRLLLRRLGVDENERRYNQNEACDKNTQSGHGRQFSDGLHAINEYGLIVSSRLNQFNLVSFRGIDKGDRTAFAMGMRAIAEWIAFLFRFARELFEVVHLEGQMSEIRADYHRPA